MERPNLEDSLRYANARKAVENGRKEKEEKVLIDLRQHYKVMSRGFNGKRS